MVCASLYSPREDGDLGLGGLGGWHSGGEGRRRAPVFVVKLEVIYRTFSAVNLRGKCKLCSQSELSQAKITLSEAFKLPLW